MGSFSSSRSGRRDDRRCSCGATPGWWRCEPGTDPAGDLEVAKDLAVGFLLDLGDEAIPRLDVFPSRSAADPVTS
jgi:hypothetical protein